MPSARPSIRKTTTVSNFPETHPLFIWMTRLALALAAAITLARITITETNISPFDMAAAPAPAAVAVDPPRTAGPAEGLVLDLLACVPALLVLGRRAFDPTFRLRLAGSQLPMLLLGAWALMSPLWASDKFSAAVASAHWFAAMLMLWAVSQSVRRWLHFRIIAALCLGVLLALASHALYYKWVDAPELRATLAKSAADGPISTQPADFARRQFQIRIASEDLSGFSVSANTFGAQLMLLATVLIGIAIQRWQDDKPIDDAATRSRALVAAPLAGVVVVLAIIPLTGSRTAIATIMMAFIAIALAWIFRPLLHRFYRITYWIGLAIVMGVGTWVVRYGITHGRLFHESLSFRWRYWIGAMRVFKLHWLTGIGWDNFSEFYIGQRLLEATEEPRDPHNFIVRFFTELGVVGGVLALVWLLRLARELTLPRLMPADVERAEDRHLKTPSAVTILLLICVMGMAISVFANLDFSSDMGFVIFELLGRFSILFYLLVGASFAAIRHPTKGDSEDRPAPWILYPMLIGLGLFLLHNMIDFSLFENGALFLFVLLAGAASGVRLGGMPDRVPSRAGTGSLLPRLALGAGVCLFFLGAGAFVGPVVVAESSTAAADQHFRHGEFLPAADGYAAALQSVPYNGDYAYRASQALFGARREFRSMIDRAVALDPVSSKYVLNRAKMNLARQPHDPRDDAQIRADLDRAVTLDPQNSDMWIDAGSGYEALHDKGGAIERYQHALDLNARLDPLENDRLTEAKVAEVEGKVAQLKRL